MATLEAEYELVARVQADSLALITENDLDKAEEKRFLGTLSLSSVLRVMLIGSLWNSPSLYKASPKPTPRSYFAALRLLGKLSDQLKRTRISQET